MQLDVFWSDDYAGLYSGKYQFYYGYEVTLNDEDDDSEWCFQVKENGREIYKTPQSEIDKITKNCSGNIDSPKDYLLAGIGIWLLLKDLS